MRRTPSVLSDGRELIYFDPDDAPPREARDSRGLVEGSTRQGSVRFDLLTGEWVSVANHRQSRVMLPGAHECPLCPSRGDRMTEIPESSYNVVAFENRSPSFMVGDEGMELPLSLEWGQELPAHGRCEVVAFTDDHLGSIATLSPAHMSLLMDAWVDRSRHLAEVPGVRYVFVFENRGAEVGVTLHHPHGQIYAYPYVPPFAARLLEQAHEFRQRHGTGLLDHILAQESDGPRVVLRTDHWIAFVPYAARWPFEVQIHPLRARRDLTELDGPECEDFSQLYPRLIRALDSVFDQPLPYMSGWLQRPVTATHDEAEDSRLFLRLISNRRATDKLKVLAGSESLMGAFVSDVSPEDAAELVRTAVEATT